MVFILRGGPRDGQLVDELPTGYARDHREPASQIHLDILDGITANVVSWDPVRAGGAADA